MTKTKRVTIDARWLHTGLGTYTSNLLRSIRSINSEYIIRAIIRNCDSKRTANLYDEVRIVNAPIYSVREQFEIPFAARGTDLLHVPHYNIPLLWAGGVVVTVHDIIHLTHECYRWSSKSRIYAWPMLKAATRKARHLITVSEHSKAQLVDHLRVPPERITVIYNGVSPDFDPSNRNGATDEVSRSLGINYPFILYVGNLKPHKNLGLLLKAFAQLCKRKFRDLRLLIVGDDRKWRKCLVKECSELKLDGRVVFVSQLSHGLLVRIYATADLLVMPSVTEGFGLPVLEAMASGTPVVCARAAALPEVGGEAVEYFDPYEVDDLVGAIDRVLSSCDLQRTLRCKGLERARAFTWDECAKLHLELYRQVLAD